MKLISLNIEGNRHLALVQAFLKKENADVVCLQELFLSDGHLLAETLGMHFAFAPMYLELHDRSNSESSQEFGIGIFSRESIENIHIANYWSPSSELKQFDRTSFKTKRETERGVLFSADTRIEHTLFPIAVTHFTWTPNGAPDVYQEKDADALLALLSKMPEVILCGDFNIPRDYNSLYNKFAAEYTDAIPRTYTSSLDLNLHRAAGDPVQRESLARFMVDYIFLSKKYRAENVHLESGVSDHKAVIANIFPL